MADDQDLTTDTGDSSSGDPSTQPVVISQSEFPVLFATLHYSSADDMLQSIGVDPASVSDDNDLPVA